MDWLGISDSNTRMTESESVALPLGESPMSFVFCLFILSNFLNFGKRFYTLFYKFFKKSKFLFRVLSFRYVRKP